jgi:hypothetical protein
VRPLTDVAAGTKGGQEIAQRCSPNWCKGGDCAGRGADREIWQPGLLIAEVRCWPRRPSEHSETAAAAQAGSPICLPLLPSKLVTGLAAARRIVVDVVFVHRTDRAHRKEAGAKRAWPDQSTMTPKGATSRAKLCGWPSSAKWWRHRDRPRHRRDSGDRRNIDEMSAALLAQERQRGDRARGYRSEA